MGRDEHSKREHRSSQSKETKDERMIRKAKEYIEKEKRKSKSDDHERRRKRRHENSSDSNSSDEERRRRRRHDDRRDYRDEKRSKRDRRSRDEGRSHEDRRSRDERRSKDDRRSREDRDKRHRKTSSHRDDHRGSSKARKRYSDSDSESSNDSRHHRHRHSRKSHKKQKKKDSRKEKHREKTQHSQKEKTKPDKASLYPLGNLRGGPPSQLLDVENDYFSYHQHLWVYLYREEGVAFNDLTSEESREAFHRFVQKYNEGGLEVAYYDGLPSEAIQQCKTTRHEWSFKTSTTELKSLELLQEGVRKQTEYNAANPSTTTKSVAKRPMIMPMNEHKSRTDENPDNGRELAQGRARKDRAGNKRLREHVRTTMEELEGGRKDGRERLIEKRKEKAAQIHGSAKDREEARTSGVELTDDAIYGAGGDLSFQTALAKERKRNAQREERKAARIQELQKKEGEKQEAMLKMLGLSSVKPGQKITIAPRKDG